MAAICASDNNKSIGTWLDDVGREGHSVTTKTMPTGCSVGDVFEAIQGAAPAHTQMFGALPIPSVRSDVDGHTNPDGTLRAGDCLGPYCSNSLDVWKPDSNGIYGNQFGFAYAPAVRTVSMIDGSNLAQIGTEAVVIDKMLAYNHAYRTGLTDYGGEACFVDYLDQLLVIRPRIMADLQAVVGGEAQVHDLSTNVDADRYHFFQVNAGKRFLAGGFFDGGLGRDMTVGEYNTGSMLDFASGSVLVAVVLMFCSTAWMMRYWPLQRAALVGGSVAVLYDQWARFWLTGWDETTPLCSILLPQMIANIDMIFGGVGDYTVLRRVGDMAVDPRVDALTTRVSALEQEMAALGTASVIVAPPGIVISSAMYIRLDGQGSFDTTAEVAALVSAGRAWDAGHNLRDPAVGFEKRLRVKGTKNGAPFDVTFSQWQIVSF